MEWQYANLLVAGIVIATLASLVGIAGGVMWVPYLILVQGLEPKHAVMSSFLIQIFGMGSAAFTHIYKKNVYWKTALHVGPFVFAGMLVGAYLNQVVAASNVVELGMGALTMIIAFLFAFQQEEYDVQLTTDRNVIPPNKVRAQAGLFGAISGFFSVGIGDFIIPVFRSVLKIPMMNSIGTALVLNFFIAMTGGATHLILSKTYPKDFGWILLFGGIGVFIGGQIGPRLSGIIDESRLKEIFIFILMLVGLHSIYQSL
ncbi:MAG: sulfite exporter TauE/SafE family protein [Candidatus Hydrogenedentota bacterium]|nr:MAG: sulfite exporter TauE/SafE family protein [Candidatus Hydrogenedentota bacterium]